MARCPWATGPAHQGLRYINRGDLAELLDRPFDRPVGRRRQCRRVCLQALLRSVHRALVATAPCAGPTLCPSDPAARSGARDAQGPRWTPQSRTFQDLRAVLADLPTGAGAARRARFRQKARCCGISNWTTPRPRCRRRTTRPRTRSPFCRLNGLRPARRRPVTAPVRLAARTMDGRNPDLPPLDALLQQRRVTLLLDALNEMPQTGLESLLRWKPSWPN